MDGGRRKHSLIANQRGKLQPQYFAAETEQHQYVVGVSHKLCDGTNEMIVFERRRNQLALKLNDAALALSEEPGGDHHQKPQPW